MTADAEKEALRAAQQSTSDERASLRQRMLNAATADLKGGAASPGVRWWLKYLIYGRGRSPLTRLTASSRLEDKLEAEQLLMDFALWLAMCKPSGKAISAKTIAKYISAVRAWHLRTQGTALCGDLPTNRVRDLVRGIARTQQQPEQKVRWGVRTQDLANAIARCLDTSTPKGAMWAAVLTTAFCGLMRGAEVGLQDGETFDAVRHLTRADLQFRTNAQGERYACCCACGQPRASRARPRACRSSWRAADRCSIQSQRSSG